MRTVSQDDDGFWHVSGEPANEYFPTQEEAKRVAANLDAIDATAGSPVDEANQDAALASLKTHALLTGGTVPEIAEFIDDSDRLPGTLFSANSEALGLFMAVPKEHYPPGDIVQSPSPMEILDQAARMVWVRVDKLSRPAKAQPTLYLGCVGTPLARSGRSPSQGFMSLQYLSEQFDHSLQDINPEMEIILTDNAPSPLAPGGDFRDGIALEAGGTVNANDVARFNPVDGTAVALIADSDANVALALGVAVQGAGPSEGQRRLVLLANVGQRKFNPEGGVTFAAGDPFYPSATEAGHVTNVAPAHARQIGVCLSNTESGVLGLLRGLV
jgi:hypothetical protein